MHTLEVGKLYNPNRRRWPQANQYNFRGGQHELVLFFPAPSRHEVEAARVGAADFALYVDPPLLVLCYRFEKAGRGIPWSDAPYSYHLVAAAEREPPPPVEEVSPALRATLQVILVDADTGIVRALRLVSLSPEFTRALHAAIARQAERPFDSAAYDRALAGLYHRYPTTTALVAACTHTTKGGA